MSHFRKVYLLLLLLLLTACGGTPGANPNPNPQPTPSPQPTEVGQPLGEAASTTLGPAGGKLASVDGRLTVNVPAGAVNQEEVFSVQEITNFAPGKVGKAYRLSPEGVSFAQPVTVEFNLDEAEVGSSPADSVVATYQTSENYWAAPSDQSYDATSHKLTVKTTHFSDWSPVAGAQLKPWTARVKVGKTVDLTLDICADPLDWPEPDGTTSQVFTDCGPNGVLDHVVRNWSVNGVMDGNASVGTITSTTPGHATYTAPAQKPSGNPVAVSVQYNALDGGLVTLVANITVEDDAGAWSGTITYHEEGSHTEPAAPPITGQTQTSVSFDETITVTGVKLADPSSVYLTAKNSSSYSYTETYYLREEDNGCTAGPTVYENWGDSQAEALGTNTSDLTIYYFSDEDGGPGTSYRILYQPIEALGTKHGVFRQKAVEPASCPPPVTNYDTTHETTDTVSERAFAEQLQGTVDPAHPDHLTGSVTLDKERNGVPTTVTLTWDLTAGK